MGLLRKGRKMTAAMLFSFLCAAICSLPWNNGGVLFFNSSPSLPRGLYVRAWDSRLYDGGCVVYRPTDAVLSIIREHGWATGDEVVFVKRVGALPGETYFVDDTSLRFCVNGAYVGQVVETDHSGKPMPRLRGEFTVPAGEFLPVTAHPRSFDGRYTGTVPQENIIAKVVPLLVESGEEGGYGN